MIGTIQQHWWWRGLGVVTLLAALTVYAPGEHDAGQSLMQQAVQGVLLPLVIGGAAVMVVQSWLAVLLAAALLAGIHAQWGQFNLAEVATLWGQPTNAQWVSTFAYPTLCVVCTLGAAAILLQRFRQKIQATHEQRWQQRRSS